MRRFVVYNKVTGQILRTGTCQDIDFKSQGQGIDEKVIEGAANDIRQKVVDGKVVDRPPREIPSPKIAVLRIQPTKDEWSNILNRIEALENR